jgi:phosphatidate cytidylyltransferase
MAFNIASFKTRTLSAVMFVIVMLSGLLLNYWSFSILISIIHFGCWLEYQRLVARIDAGYAEVSLFHKYAVMIAGWSLLWYFSQYTLSLFGASTNKIALAIGLGLMLLLIIVELFAVRKMPKNISHSIFGLIYISLSWGLFTNFYNYAFYLPNNNVPFAKEPFSIVRFDHPWVLPAIVIGCMWVNDTMAYIVGSLIGRTPLSRISPKKTWEGTVGGIVLCIAVVGSLLSYVLINEEPLFSIIAPVHWYLIPAIAATAGTFGDLLESKLKRLAHAKDSGHLMPGHGGFLDRFDSLLMATPFVWLYIKLFVS